MSMLNWQKKKLPIRIIILPTKLKFNRLESVDNKKKNEISLQTNKTDEGCSRVL